MHISVHFISWLKYYLMSCAFRSESSIRSYSSRLNEGKAAEISATLIEGLSKEQTACDKATTPNTSTIPEVTATTSTAPEAPPSTSTVPSTMSDLPDDDIFDDNISDELLMSVCNMSQPVAGAFAPTFHNCSNITINFKM